MKELTYLHCQCFTTSTVANNLFAYAKVNPGMPAIFVILDSTPEDKRTQITTMRKMLASNI